MSHKFPEQKDNENKKVLKIQVKPFEEFADESFDAVSEAIETGEKSPAAINFESPGEALSLFGGSRYGLLRTIKREDPGSIRELARMVDLNKSTVLEALEDLEEYGIIQFQREGQSKRPIVMYDKVEIDIDLDLT